jgi:adenylate cyclase
MSDNKRIDADAMWRDWFTVSAAEQDFKRMRRVFRALPHDPRCQLCNAPFRGIGGGVARLLFGKQPSAMNPRFCDQCEQAARRFPGGAEVEMSILFADIRGSTTLAEKMSPKDYSRLISRFYSASTKTIIHEDGLVEKLAGDEVVAFWGAGFAGPDYVLRTLKVAQSLTRVLADEGIPVGIGVHCGTAFFGAMSTAEGMIDVSAKGEALNVTARLCSKAAAGEIIVSEQALQAAGMDGSKLESRSLELKGISEPVAVRVMRVERAS